MTKKFGDVMFFCSCNGVSIHCLDFLLSMKPRKNSSFMDSSIWREQEIGEILVFESTGSLTREARLLCMCKVSR